MPGIVLFVNFYAVLIFALCHPMRLVQVFAFAAILRRSAPINIYPNAFAASFAGALYPFCLSSLLTHFAKIGNICPIGVVLNRCSTLGTRFLPPFFFFRLGFLFAFFAEIRNFFPLNMVLNGSATL